MFIARYAESAEFISRDGCVLRELIHPAKTDLDLRYSLAHAVLPAGRTSTPHRLKNSEVYYIISGSGTMFVHDEASPVGAGDTVYIPPGAVQYLENPGPGDIVFICIVDPAWQPEDEEIIQSA